MEQLTIYLGIIGALLAGAISPGPSFIFVCRTAMQNSRKAGISAAMGIGVGGAIFACLALGGLVALLKEVPILYVILKIFGGLYLLYLGFRIWRGATENLHINQTNTNRPEGSLASAFWMALVTQMSNPKTAIVYGSIFAAFLPDDPNSTLLIALIPGVLLIEFFWYAVVAMVFSITKPREVYMRAKLKIDRIVGSLLGLLGGQLLFDGTFK
jgi:threonine/homoserine/homoserine lactone efflux protein